METDEANLANRVALFLSGMRSELADVAVSVEKDTVRLTGQVDSFYLRQLAIGGAMRVAGVRHVDDRIQVKGPPRKPR